MIRRLLWIGLSLCLAKPSLAQTLEALPAAPLAGEAWGPLETSLPLSAAPETASALPGLAERPAAPSLSALPLALPAPTLVEPLAAERAPAPAPEELSRGLAAAEERPAALGSFFDGQGRPTAAADPTDARAFLFSLSRQARSSLFGRTQDAALGLQALETIAWARSYLPQKPYEQWLAANNKRLAAIDRRLEREVVRRIEAELDEGDFSAAREALEELAARHRLWADWHDAALAPLRRRLPSEDQKAEPRPPLSEPDRLAELVVGHLEAGEFRHAEYLMTSLERKHEAWAEARQGTFAQWRRLLLEGTYRAFEARKSNHSAIELRRLSEYTKALAEGSNRGYGFKQPAKQDPNSRMCTIMSLYEAFEASIGFEDPSMSLEKFTTMVRRLLKDDSLGDRTGLSTHRMRALMKELGLPLKVIEMQERLKRPFEEAELTRLIRPGQLVIPVFIIVQEYPDEKGLQREEHKGFLRDAYYSETEKRWVFLMADPLIGRVSFYTWPELKPFLHKLFVIKSDQPLAFDPAP